MTIFPNISLHCRYVCNACDFKTNLKTKIKDHHERARKFPAISRCNLCDFKSCTYYGLVFHKSKTHGVTKAEKKFICGYCEQTFTLQDNFQNHVLKKHMGGQGQYACDLCDFKTFDRFYIRIHKKNHESTTKIKSEIMPEIMHAHGEIMPIEVDVEDTIIITGSDVVSSE